MSASGKKLWLVITVALALLGIGAFLCYIPLSQFHKATMVRKLIEGLPGSLQVQNVTVDILADSVELDGLSGTVEYFQGLSFDVRARKIRLEGVTWDSDTIARTGKLADVIVAEHLSFTPGTAFSLITGYSSATVSHYSAKGLWLDWGLLMEAGRSGPHSKVFADLLLSLRLGATSVRDASLRVTERTPGENLAGEDYIIAVSRLEMDGYSIRSTGKSKTWNYSQVYANGARFTAKEISFASRATPSESLRLTLAGLMSRQNFSRENSLKLLKEGYSLRGLECKELLVITKLGESLHVPSLLADIDIGNGNLLMKIDAPDIWVSGSLVAGALIGLDSRLGFLSDRKLHFSSLVDWKVEPSKEDSVRLVCHQELHETRLGSAVLHTVLSGGKAVGPERILPFTPASLVFEKGVFELEDDKFLDDFFSYVPEGAPNGADKPETLRASRDAAVEAVKAAVLPAFMRGASGRFAQLLEKSGFFSIEAECIPPLAIVEAFNNPAEFEKLSLKATYSQ